MAKLLWLRSSQNGLHTGSEGLNLIGAGLMTEGLVGRAAKEDEDEDDQSPRARVLREILQAGRPVQENQASEEDNPEDPGEAVRNMEAASKDEEK